jgi:putative N-acetylmannosamine-6-phosphate epimerase
MLVDLDRLKGRLLVSCQAAPGDPLENTDALRRIAKAALRGGAAGLRINSPEHIAAIRQDTDLPIIGIRKQYFGDKLRITPDFASAAALAAAGASIIALDCTKRSWPAGEPWQEIIQRIHTELRLPVMADVATLEEALAAEAAGADFAGPTLHGYTEDTLGHDTFNWDLLAEMYRRLRIPIIAEGHISTPEDARRAVLSGAWCVVVGSAITRPGTITANFIRVMEFQSPTAPAIGVDIGGTAVKAGLVDRDGSVSHAVQVSTNAALGKDAIARSMQDAVQQVLALARLDSTYPAGLGIASAGAMDSQKGVVFAATDNLPGWTGFPLRNFAEDLFHLPTYIVNDAQAAVLAELHFGVGRQFSSFAAITIGTGVGGGVVSQGRLLTGHHGFAGTIGHHTIQFGGLPSNCGRQGCLEAYVSTAALIREYQRLCPGGLAPGLSDAEAAMQIGQLAASGDKCASQAYSILARYLAEGIANLFNIFDPEIVLLSGGLIAGQSRFPSEVQDHVAQLLHFGDLRKPQIQFSLAGRYAGLQGAASLVFAADGKPR